MMSNSSLNSTQHCHKKRAFILFDIANIEVTYRGLLIAPKPPRPRYPRPAPRNPLPRPRGGLLLVVMPGLFVRFGSTLICLPLKNNLFGFVKTDFTRFYRL